MIEIKYLKDLPCKQINTSSHYVSLVGGDIYVDANGGRYVFFGFNNNHNRPFFAIYLEIKQYDGSGTLIKNSKYRFPSIYARKGLFVTPEPIPVERECNGCEVYVSYADYGEKVFINDQFVRRSASASAPRFGYVPQSPGINPQLSEFNPVHQETASSTPVVEPMKEEVKAAEVKQETAKPEPVISKVENETEVEEKPVVAETKKEVSATESKNKVRRKGRMGAAQIIMFFLALGIGIFMVNYFSEQDVASRISVLRRTITNFFDLISYYIVG